MRRNLVIMTKSKKGDFGYCVTGIDIDSNEWVRLNVRGEYSFPRNLFHYENGIEVQVLDTISIELISKDNSSRLQPENYYCNPSTIRLIPSKREKVVNDRLESDRRHHKEIFYNTSNHIVLTEASVNDKELYSLMIIQPEDLVFRRNEKGRLLASFNYEGNKYSGIRVTDIDYYNSDLFPQGKSIIEKKQYLFVMSLGEQFYNPISGNAENWKFVAAIIEKELIKDRYISETKANEVAAGVISHGRLDEQSILIRTTRISEKASFENYEELHNYFRDSLEVYNNTKYTIENVEQARTDLAVLKVIRKKLTNAKKTIEAEYNAPIKDVVQQLDSLIDMVKKPYGIIDKMLKDNEKTIKEREIKRYAYNKALILDQYAISVVESRSFFNPRWRNISYRDSQWKKDIDEIINRAKKDIERIEKEGGNNRSAMLAFYFDRLSLDGIDIFLRNLGNTSGDTLVPFGNTSTNTTMGVSGSDDGKEKTVEESKNNESEKVSETIRKAVVISGCDEDVSYYLKEASKYRVTVESISDSDYSKPDKQEGNRCNRCESFAEGKCVNEESEYFDRKVSCMNSCNQFKRFRH